MHAVRQAVALSVESGPASPRGLGFAQTTAPPWVAWSNDPMSVAVPSSVPASVSVCASVSASASVCVSVCVCVCVSVNL